MNIVAIEKGIPYPKRKTGPGAPRKYPLDEMEVGDSIFVEKYLVSSITKFQDRHPERKFSQRAVDGGVRVWRIK